MSAAEQQAQGGLVSSAGAAGEDPPPFMPLGDDLDVLPSERYRREHGDDAEFTMPEGLSADAYEPIQSSGNQEDGAQDQSQEEEEEQQEGEFAEGDAEGLEEGEIPADEEELVSATPVSHPLQSTWVLWYDSAGKATANNWGENMKEVISFSTVEDFWGIFNNIIPCSRIPNGANYYVFRNGIKPEWEDPANKSGGKWQVTLPNSPGKEKDAQDAWLYAVMSAIGETYEQDEMICGVVAANRKQQYRIAMWIRCDDSTPNRPTTEAIGRRLKDAVSNAIGVRPLEFTPHQAAMTSTSKAGGVAMKV